MSNFQLPGLLSGIDTKTLIAQLMIIEQRSLKIYQQRKVLWEEKKQALSILQAKLMTLRNSVQALSDSQDLRTFNVSSSDSDILTAEASYNAFEGNHAVVINQLATAERWVHTNGLEYAEDYIDDEAGTFIYYYNNKETTITTTATTTLEDLVGLINNDADNPGVTANILYHNDSYHLVLNGNEAGSDYQIFINASNTEVWEAESALTANGNNATLSSKIIDLDQFNGTLAGNEKILMIDEEHNKDHNGNVISMELNITSNTKLSHLISEINNAFDGRAIATLVNGEIRLMDNTCGTSQMELTLSYNPGSGSTTLDIPVISQSTQGGSITANLTGFAVSDFTKTQSAQDSKIKVDGYPSTSAVAEVQHLSFTDEATAGTFTLTYDGQTTAAIDYDATLVEIQTALEALSNVDSGDITVGGDILNNNNGTMTFTFRDTLGNVSLISINPSSLTPSDNSNYVMTEYTKGNDGWISRSSNTVDNIITGVTMHLHDTTDANGEELTLTRDVGSVKTKLNSMISSYNAAVSHIKEQTEYDNEQKKAGTLMGDYIVSTIQSLLNTPFITQASGFVENIDTFLTPGHIGLELDKDGVLSLDTNVFDEAIAQDYMDVLALIGADKTGSSTSNTVKFYSASSDYTTAGTYDVKVEVNGAGAITSAKIKLSTESTYRNATYSGNVVTGNSSFDDNGNPVYPENGLQLSVDLSQEGIFTATVRVKQGFAGAIEEALDQILKTTNGPLEIDQEHIDKNIDDLQDKIELEERRLTQRETRLVERFARLEKTLTLLQNQMASLAYFDL